MAIGTADGYVQIGTTTVPASELGVWGGATIGTSYLSHSAPTNGLLVQGIVGIGTSSPNANAALDLGNTTTSMIVPSGPTEPGSPVAGMMRYNTATSTFEGYDGTGWYDFGGALGTFDKGTAAAPGWAVTQDTASGLFQSATTGTLSIAAGGVEAARFLKTTSAVDYLTITGSTTGNSLTVGPTISAAGTDANVSLTITPKGTGSTIIGSGNVGIGFLTPPATLSVTPYLSNIGTSLTNIASTAIFGNNVAIGSTAASYNYPFEFQTSAANIDRLQIAQYRRAAGSGWPGTAYRLQYAVDNSFTNGSLAYVEIGADDPANSGSGFISFGTGGNDRLSINSSGNVGIGTTSPSNALHVYGGAAEIQNDDSSNPPTELLIAGKTNSSYQLSIGYNTTSNYGSIQSNYAGHGWSSLALNANGGNVGIGTTSPQAGLQISNNIGTAGTANMIQIYNNNAGSIMGLGVSSGQLNVVSGAATAFYNNGSPTMIINTSGSVGIGTATPTDALDVYSGGIHMGSSVPTSTTYALYNNGGTLMWNGSSVGGGSSTSTLGTSVSVPAPYGSATDTQTGLYTAGAGKVDVTISGTKTVEWSSNGEYVAQGGVGIGTTTLGTNAKLAVNGGLAVGSYANTGIGPTSNGLIVSGNVGIGTATPLSGLHVNPSTTQWSGNNYGADIVVQDSIGRNPAIALLDYTAANPWAIANVNNAPAGGSAGTLMFAAMPALSNASTGANIAMVLTPSGNIGIGTQVPGAPLHVSTSGTGTTFGSNVIESIRSQASGREANMQFCDGTNTCGYLSYLNGASTPRLGFGIGSEAVSILNGGNVGIGTTSPGATLDINSAATFPTPILRIKGTDANVNLALQNTGTGGRDYRLLSSNNSASPAGALRFYDNTAAADRMVISSGGFVGIGTAAPGWPFHAYSSNASSTIYGTNTSTGNGITGLSSGGYGIVGATSAGGSTYYGGYFSSGGNWGGIGRADGYAFVGGGQIWVTGNIYENSGYPVIETDPSGAMLTSITFQYNGGSPYIEYYSPTYGPWGGAIWASDERMKNKIADSSYVALDKLKQIRFISYNWKPIVSTDPGKHVDLGFSAQNLKTIEPEWVIEIPKSPKANDTRLMPNQATLIPAITKAVVELSKQVDDLRGKFKEPSDNDHSLLVKLEALSQTDHDAVMKLKADNDNLRALVAKLGQEFEAYKARHP